MKAVVEVGGKQYFVKKGTVLYVEKIAGEVNSVVDLDKVLMCNGVSGRPYLPNVKVKARIKKHDKQRKITIFKYKPKKKYRRTQGHRQPYTMLVVEEIVVK